MNLKEILGDLYTPEIEKRLDGKKVYIAEGENDYVPKTRFDDVNNKYKDSQAIIAERDKQLESLGASSKTIDELNAQIKSLQDDNAAKQKEFDEKYESLAYGSYFKEQARNHNIKSKFFNQAMSQINKEKITKNEDGTYKGLEEEITRVLQEYPEFVEIVTPGKMGKAPGGDGKASLEARNERRKEMGLPPLQ